MGAGEREAISLAVEQGICNIITDDNKGIIISNEQTKKNKSPFRVHG